MFAYDSTISPNPVGCRSWACSNIAGQPGLRAIGQHHLTKKENLRITSAINSPVSVGGQKWLYESGSTGIIPGKIGQSLKQYVHGIPGMQKAGTWRRRTLIESMDQQLRYPLDVSGAERAHRVPSGGQIKEKKFQEFWSNWVPPPVNMREHYQFPMVALGFIITNSCVAVVGMHPWSSPQKMCPLLCTWLSSFQWCTPSATICRWTANMCNQPCGDGRRFEVLTLTASTCQ